MTIGSALHLLERLRPTKKAMDLVHDIYITRIYTTYYFTLKDCDLLKSDLNDNGFSLEL